MKQRKTQMLRSQGFTLLELLLVVVILASVAWMLTSTVDDNISQVRYEDTRNRLDAIRTAVLGPNSPATWANGLQGGFVVDNGILPENIRELVENPDYDENGTDDYDTYGEVYPIFGVGTSDEFDFETLSDPKPYVFLKGHRGHYLPATKVGDKPVSFRDGWGSKRSSGGDTSLACPSATDHGFGTTESNDDDDTNYGWCVTTNNQSIFFVDSLGMDGELGSLTGHIYEDDMRISQPIYSYDWSLPVSGRIKVINKSGSNIELSTTVNFTAALIVYSNDTNGDDDTWTTHPLAVALEPVQNLDNGDGYDSSIPTPVAWSASQDFDITISTASPIPAGEHLLVLAYDADGDPNTTNDINVDLDDIDDVLATSGWPSSAQFVTKRVRFYPHGGWTPNPMTLEIR
ncbi:prepilin-type N-terminal cleavage/methylation domain-containing protein [Cerasicoccus maritimus]|uniref:prepilin-type N-terminal cleavage/methylation domain-containing protein n=1 Tax=Cerasicoccus maritimus TaxID=490089 RepID=UPI002852CCB7|nr:prepilin-type N-terminal cleavage/methylation domain-containing protein [Cerasicoccus maritimus]